MMEFETTVQEKLKKELYDEESEFSSCYAFSRNIFIASNYALVTSSKRSEMDQYWTTNCNFGNRTSGQSSVHRAEATVSGE